MRKYLLTALTTTRIASRFAMLLLCFMLSSRAFTQTWNYAYGFGTAPGENTRGVCTDNSGNTYYTGTFGGTINFDPALSPAGSITSYGSSDIVIASYTSTGAFRWVVHAGSSTSVDAGFAIATDGSNVYVTGTFTGTATFGALPPIVTTGGTDAFVTKLSAATGTFTWVTKVGSGSGDGANAICLDGSNNPVITGNYGGSMTLGSTTISPTGGSSTDLYVAKFNTATGAPLWLSGGGATASGDNGNGISYAPAPLDEIIVTGSYNVATATYGALPSVSNLGLNDIIVLELNAGTGAFLSALPVSTAGDEAGLAITYDAFTQDVIFTGYFDNPTISFGSISLTGDTDDDIFMARYDPATNGFIWAVKPSGGSSLDRGNGICSNGLGLIGVTGQFENTLTFGSTTLTSISGAFADIFVAGLAATDGTFLWAGQSGGTSGTVDDVGRSISVGGPLQKMAIAGQFAGTATFGPFTLNAVGSSDLLFAQFTTPLAAITTVVNATCINGCNGSATVQAFGGTAPYTYAWSPSGGTGTTATGLCVGTYNVTVTDNASASVVKPAVVGLPTTQLATANTSNTTVVVSANNSNIYDASCNLIAKVVPSGASPVSGIVSAKVWFEPSVQTDAFGVPYVQRHYEIQPATNAATATATITLYFTQTEFNTFNAYPGVTLLLPTGTGDGPGKSRVRLSQLKGVSSNGTGLPGTYAGSGVLIDPVDANIVFNATDNRWEITFAVSGFSGFFLQTTQAVLPVVWQSVNGSVDAQGKVNLHWAVQEQQVASYSIEKSLDGQAYTAIGTVNAQGDGEHTYSYQEPTALSGKASYRIRQIDIDGRSTYSKVILLRSNRQVLVTLYPNPVKGSATLNVTDKELINSTAILYDGTGREMQRILITQSVTTIKMHQYNSGVYTLRLKNGQLIRILKE